MRKNGEVDRFTGRCLRRASEIREGAERDYQRFTFCTYFLYFLGWTLASLGKLVGGGAAELERG
jgi:hypothetical protein